MSGECRASGLCWARVCAHWGEGRFSGWRIEILQAPFTLHVLSIRLLANLVNFASDVRTSCGKLGKFASDLGKFSSNFVKVGAELVKF